MHLKNLTLKGFKSFADAASIDLEPGVTVVVGPNGSGKSNVVDAIAWVLGAQAPSAVRSGKMDDVIFAGSQNKAALGRAEVARRDLCEDRISSPHIYISQTIPRVRKSNFKRRRLWKQFHAAHERRPRRRAA